MTLTSSGDNLKSHKSKLSAKRVLFADLGMTATPRSIANLKKYDIYILNKNQLHTVSHTLQGRQREPSVKIIRSPLSA